MIRELAEVCRGHFITLQMHNYPDVDAIASAWGLQYLLKTFDIESRIVYGGDINRTNTHRLVECYHIPLTQAEGEFKDDDYIVTVDCQDNGGNVSRFGGHILACVDHHPEVGNVDYPYRFIESTGACATHITHEFAENNIEMPESIATALLFGLKMDTMQFTRGVTDEDIDAFKYLHFRANDDTIHYLDNLSVDLEDLKAFGSAIANIRVVGDIGITYVPFDCADGLIAALADFILGVNELDVVVVLSQRSSGVKLSVRSIVSEIDAGKLTRQALAGIGFGGGHAMFAGGFIPNENLPQNNENVLKEMLGTRFMKAYGSCLMDTV